MMRVAALVFLVIALGAAEVAADQSDERLNRLFRDLRASRTVDDARAYERQIWAIWGEMDDEQGAALLAHGSAAMAASDLDRALDQFDMLVARAPDFAEGWNKRATLFYLMGRYQESVADIHRTLALEPRHFGALFGLGLIMMALDRPRMALESFEAALALHPHLPAANAYLDELQDRVLGEPL